jgi:hypothetical protein
MVLQIVRFLAVILTALSLVPAGAHLFELPNKIGLAQEPYFVVQGIYRGWALFGLVLIPAMIVDLALAGVEWRRGGPFWLPLAAFLCMAATLAVFFTWVYPANVATNNWTMPPPNWAELRTHWEYGHAVNALLTFVALCAVTLSVLAARD